MDVANDSLTGKFFVARNIDFPIPANDDAAKSIMLITRVITDAIAEGLQERKREKDEVEAERGKEESVQATGSEEEVSAE